MLDILTLHKGKIYKGKIDEITKKDRIALVDAVQPTKSELDKISKLTHIDIKTLAAFTDPTERPRVEELEKNTVILYRYPLHTKIGVRTSSIAIILSATQNYLIILQKEIDHLIDAVKNLEDDAKKKVFEHGINYVLYKILDNISKHFFKELEYIEERTEKLERKILKTSNKNHVKEILDLKKTLTYFHKAIIANRNVINAIEKGFYKHISKKIQPYLREIYHDLSQLNDLEETRKEILTGTLDIHLSTMSNSLNIIMKRLTVVAALIWIPTLIAAIYGMNFGQPLTPGVSPLNMPELNWFYGYPFALGTMVLSVSIMYLWFKKQKWI